MKILQTNRIAPDGTPRSAASRGYSVCLCPIKGTPGLNELSKHLFCCLCVEVSPYIAFMSSDTPSLAAQILEVQADKKLEDTKKYSGPLGLEMVEYISAATSGE